jgi:hypothetical protein
MQNNTLSESMHRNSDERNEMIVEALNERKPIHFAKHRTCIREYNFKKVNANKLINGKHDRKKQDDARTHKNRLLLEENN